MVTNKKRVVTFLFLLIILSFSVYAVGDYVFKQNEAVDLKIPCYDGDNLLCNSSTICLISVNEPNGDSLIKNLTMSYNYNYYNYSFGAGNLSVLGQYAAFVSCYLDSVGGFQTFYFDVTENGKVEVNNLLPIILGFIFFILFFSGSGLYFTVVNKNFALRFFSFGFVLIELVYLVGILFIFESGGGLIGLLRINFYTMAITCFGIGMIGLFMHSLKIATPEEEMTEEEIEGMKWGSGGSGKSKW